MIPRKIREIVMVRGRNLGGKCHWTAGREGVEEGGKTEVEGTREDDGEGGE